MSARLARSFAAHALLVGGCTAFGSNNEPSLADAGANEGSPEAGDDGGADGPGGRSFCASAGGTYCRDFDDGVPVTAGYTTTNLTDGAISFVAASSTISPPTALRLTVQPDQSSVIHRGFVEQALVIPTTANGVSCSATVVAEEGSFPDQIFAFAIDSWLLEIRAREDTGKLYLSNTPPFETADGVASLLRRAAQPQRLTLRLQRAGRGSCTNSRAEILVDDVVAVSRCLSAPSSFAVRLRLGVSHLDRPHEGWQTLYDNVRCDLL